DDVPRVPVPTAAALVPGEHAGVPATVAPPRQALGSQPSADLPVASSNSAQ
ncbi:unnamed protein product, partial [Nesidiocoris tenuis]